MRLSLCRMLRQVPQVCDLLRRSAAGRELLVRLQDHCSRSRPAVIRNSYALLSARQQGNLIVAEDGGSDFKGASVNELSTHGPSRSSAPSDR